MLESPYESGGTWLRGNLHTHTTVSDGSRTPKETMEEYAASGYDFLAISDHSWTVPEEGTYFDLHGYKDETDLLLVPAVEESGPRGAGSTPHVLHLGSTEPAAPNVEDDLQAIVDAIEEHGGEMVAAHPNAGFDQWSLEDLGRLEGNAGIEIYNGMMENLAGPALATDRWDQLLSAGRRVWGFANDDAHRAWHVARGWNVVQVEERSPEAVLDAIFAGRFYASTGVTITEIQVDEGDVTVTTSDADRIRLVSDHGVIQQTVHGSQATFRVPDHLVHSTENTYVRVECDGRGGAMAWTQPMFLERGLPER